MVKHIVMWKLKDFAEGACKEDNLKKMKARLEAMKSKIHVIKHFEIGINFDNSEDAYDIVLYSEFESKKDLDVYQKHLEHVKVKKFIQKVRLEKKVVDYEI